MPLTNNWKKLNLFNWFYQVQYIDPVSGNNFQYPFEVILNDGTSISPRVGFNNYDHYADAYMMYGMISPTNELGTKPQRCKEGFKLALGSGTAPFDEDDYCLENEITITQDKFRNEANRIEAASLYFNGLIDNKICMEISGTNTSNDIWQINEIGIYTRISNMTNINGSVSSQYYDHWSLMLREVLNETVEVQPNKQYSIHFELSI